MGKSGMLLAAVLVSTMLGGCTQTVVIKDAGPEVLLPGELIETVDANVIRVRCQGTATDQEAAILQARKACVEWLITNQLAQTPQEQQAYKVVQPQIFAQLDKYIGVPGPGARDGKGKGVKSRTRLSETRIQVAIIEDVQKKTLTDDLVAMKVLTSKDDMLAGVGMPTLMVHPSKANKGSQYRKIMEDLINSFLTKAKWEVLDAKGVEDLDKLTNAIGEVSDATEDEAAKLAMAIGADVYIVFEAKKEKGKPPMVENVAYSVGISAFETTTGRKLASDTALSSPRATMVAGEESAALMEALNDAMGKVIPQITDYWKEDAPKGNRFTIIFRNSPKGTDMKMSSVLKKACAWVKLSKSAGTYVSFYAQCKGDNLEIASAVSQGIEQSFEGTAFDFAAKTANNLIVVFKK